MPFLGKAAGYLEAWGSLFPDAFPRVSIAAGVRHTQAGWLPSGGAPAEDAGVSHAQSCCYGAHPLSFGWLGGYVTRLPLPYSHGG